MVKIAQFTEIAYWALRAVAAAALLGMVLSACARRNEPAPMPTSTSVQVVQATLPQTANRSFQSFESSPSPSAVDSGDDCAYGVDVLTQHHAAVTLDYRNRSARVTQRILVVNQTGESLPNLGFNIEPNRIPEAFTLEGIEMADGSAAPAFELTGRRLIVALPTLLPAGCGVEVILRYHLKLPLIGVGTNAVWGYFGYSARQTNFAHALATVAVRRGREWLAHDVARVGEQAAAEVADWDVVLTVDDAPEGLRVAAPGSVTNPEPNRWRIVHRRSRDFAVSLSAEFEVLTAQAENGTQVEVYGFNDPPAEGGAPARAALEHALMVAAESLALYDSLFGAYGRSRYVIVEGDFPDGMEFSGLAFVGGQWFRTYPGAPASYLTIITAHETAHQWWYARVGSDQALYPWLDEALATYSEYIYYSEHHPQLRDWWWQTRIRTFLDRNQPAQAVDSSVYVFDSTRAYINAVYLRGAVMLDSLRRELGTEAFFDWLRRYAENGDSAFVDAGLLWSLLTPSQLGQVEATRREFLDQS